MKKMTVTTWQYPKHSDIISTPYHQQILFGFGVFCPLQATPPLTARELYLPSPGRMLTVDFLSKVALGLQLLLRKNKNKEIH